MKKSLPAVSASYDHSSMAAHQAAGSHLVGIPYRLKDPPAILYHVYTSETRTYFLQMNEEKFP